MSQHTPGPWMVDLSEEDVLVITQDQKIAVASLWLENVDRLDAVMPDARLIAAAPRMLELVGLVVAGNTEAADLEEIAGAILRDVEGSDE